MTTPSNWHNEDGFEFALFPAKNGEAKQLVIVLHGHGSNAANWEGHARQMHKELPDADIITLQGPYRLPPGHPSKPADAEGYTWTAYQGHPLRQVKESLSVVFNHLPVVDKLDVFIDRQLKKRDLTDDDLGLVGSSMGGIVILQTALNRAKPAAGVVSHSSALLPLTKTRSKPDILLIMGTEDEVFHKRKQPKKGIKRLFAVVAGRLGVQHDQTLRRIRKRRIPFEEKLYPGMKHEVTPETVKAGDAFLLKVFGKKKKPKL